MLYMNMYTTYHPQLCCDKRLILKSSALQISCGSLFALINFKLIKAKFLSSNNSEQIKPPEK